MEITEAFVKNVIGLVDQGLTHGLGTPKPGKMCVEAVICYALGLPHGDNPESCVAQSPRRLKIGLNDCAWSSDQARARGMRRLAIAQLGSAGVVDDAEFRRRVADMTIRKAVPIGLRAAAQVNPKYAAALEAAAVRCEHEGTREACAHARQVAADAAAYAAYAATCADAYAADAAAYAAYAATCAADAYAADAAATCADAYAADAATRDRGLAQYAEWVVEILIELKSPGCRWLDLVPKQDSQFG